MIRMKKLLLIFAVVLVICAILSMARPVVTSRENSRCISGVVQTVEEAGVNDVVFKLEADSVSYYMNRGLEKGFALNRLEREVVGKRVTVFFSKSWTPLAPFGKESEHMTRLEMNGEVVYSEF